MTKNVGMGDRILRGVGGVALVVGSAIAPLPLIVRVAGLALMGGYLLFTALAGTCLGYRLIGRSTCPSELPR